VPFAAVHARGICDQPRWEPAAWTTLRSHRTRRHENLTARKKICRATVPDLRFACELTPEMLGCSRWQGCQKCRRANAALAYNGLEESTLFWICFGFLLPEASPKSRYPPFAKGGREIWKTPGVMTPSAATLRFCCEQPHPSKVVGKVYLARPIFCTRAMNRGSARRRS
jgi:hypothetical protein